VLYVAQVHLDASDGNPGTEDESFQAIKRAAREARLRDKVVVGSGSYREQVTPARGGIRADAKVYYETAPGSGQVGAAVWWNLFQEIVVRKTILAGRSLWFDRVFDL
jgi:hypothetical protein